MNFIRRLKNSKGFTLTELIVVIALIAILMTSVALFAQPVRAMVGSTNARSETQTVAEIIGSDIERNLSYANYLKIYEGVDAATAGSSAFSALKTSCPSSDSKNDGHMLVFHFEPQSDPTRSTYKIYDIPAKDYSTFTTSLLTKENLRFNDAFFANYEYFVTVESVMTDPDNNNKSYPEPNHARNKGFLTFRIEAFNFDGTKDASNNTICLNMDVLTGNGVKSIFDYRQEYLKSPSTATDDPFADISNYRVGTEVVSFALENFYLNKAANHSSSSKLNSTSSVVIEHGSFDASATPKISYGTDLIICYNIHKWTTATTTSS